VKGRINILNGLYTISEGSRTRAVRILSDQYQRLVAAAPIERPLKSTTRNTTAPSARASKPSALLKNQAVVLRDAFGFEEEHRLSGTILHARDVLQWEVCTILKTETHNRPLVKALERGSFFCAGQKPSLYWLVKILPNGPTIYLDSRILSKSTPESIPSDHAFALFDIAWNDTTFLAGDLFCIRSLHSREGRHTILNVKHTRTGEVIKACETHFRFGFELNRNRSKDRLCINKCKEPICIKRRLAPYS
jgi:hypothetical protein